MSNSFTHLVRKYHSLPEIMLDEHVETSTRYKFVEEIFKSSQNDIERGDIFVIYLDDAECIWSEIVLSSSLKLLEHCNFGVYESFGFIKFMILKNRKSIDDVLEKTLCNIFSEFEKNIYKNWFFVFDFVDTVEEIDSNTLRERHYCKIISQLMELESSIDHKEYDDVIVSNLPFLKALLKYSKEGAEREFLEHWL